MRRITVEVPTGVTMSDDELQRLAEEFKSRLIDTKAEQMVVRAKPKEKVQEVPVIVQAQEVAVPKEQTQTI
jgi:hypothetical protein